MFRKLALIAAAAGALGLAAPAIGPAQAASVHLGPALATAHVESDVVQVHRRRVRHRRHGFWIAPFIAAPFFAAPYYWGPPRHCYRYSPRLGRWVWDYRRCPY